MADKEAQETTISYGLYLEDKSFKEKSFLFDVTREARDFYNGKQYDDDNEDNAIRVSLNFCSFSAQLKASKIVGTERYITFTADNTKYDCHGLQRFDEYNVHKLNEKSKDYQACVDGYVDGTAIAGYRWDKDDLSYKGIYKGGLACETMDMLKFAVANKYINDIQNQKWVMYWKDEDVQAVRDMVERKDEEAKKEVIKRVVPDDYADTGVDKEDVNHGLCTLFTRYFRIDGEVCFMCSTKDVDLFEYPHFMNPRVNKSIEKKLIKIVDEYKKETKNGEEEEDNFDKVVDYKIDYEDMLTQITDAKILTDEDYKNSKEKFYLYPFARFVPHEMKDSFYGHGDISEMIRVQKGYNFAISMVLKCLENNAYNKIIVKEGALEGQEITNEPGQVLVDHTKMANGFGIKFAESQPMPNGVIDFAQRLFEQTRLIYGFNDVMDGSISNQDISGYAVQQMIKQANSSIEQQQQLFWQFCKEKAEIRLMFYKFYVDKAKYTYELQDYEVEERENKRNMLLNRQARLRSQGKELEIGDVDLSEKTRKMQVRDFMGKEIFGTSFDINIDVMQGLADSKLAEAQMWDTLIMNGNIQNLEPEMLELYLEANPTISQRSKATLKAIVEKQKQSENYQLKQNLQQALGYLEELLKRYRELEAQSGYKTNFINNLEKEFTKKIGVANKYITAQNKALAMKSEGEVKSDNARGVPGSHIEQGA